MRKRASYLTIWSFFVSSCITEAGFKYEIENSTNLDVEIETFNKNSFGTPKKFFIPSRNKILVGSGYSEASLSYTDSVVVIFADGRIKVDILYNYGADWVNLYNPDRYKKSSCGRKCTKSTYIIDELDYAEAK